MLPAPYPARPPASNRAHLLVKKITTGGTFRFQRRPLYLANALVDQLIGLEDRRWHLGHPLHNVLRATFDERNYIITG